MPALATDYYVDDGSGDDANAGTPGWANAFKTINQAASVSAPGDHIFVNHGVYREEINSPPAGTAGNPIVYEAIGDVVIDGEFVRNYGFFRPGPYVTIKNFKIINTNLSGIVTHLSGVTVDNCEIRNCAKLLVGWWALSFTAHCHGCVMTNNLVEDNGNGIYLSSLLRNIFVSQNTSVNNVDVGFRFNAVGSSTWVNQVVNNLVVGNGGDGIRLLNVLPPADTIDTVTNNNSFNNGGADYLLTGTDPVYQTLNFTLDPQFVSGTSFLSPTSPMLDAGTLDQATGVFRTIGARGIANVSSNAQSSWSGWLETTTVPAVPVTGSALVEVAAGGKISLKSGVTSARIVSPVVDTGTSSFFRAVRIKATQAPFLPSGQKQVIDEDNTDQSPQVRYRVSATSFAATDVLPSWATTAPGNRIDPPVTGRFIQTELLLRKDGI
ncbi:MAG: right-handed parallel beta-helix repeat-containing protein [Lentisphaeria bacterium]|nr:right-handed parallel beta-helix repeat-containing protein [Lentisphaeria bacterium]